MPVNSGTPMRAIKSIRDREGRYIEPASILTDAWRALPQMDVQGTIDERGIVDMPSSETWNATLSLQEIEKYGDKRVGERKAISNRCLARARPATTIHYVEWKGAPSRAMSNISEKGLNVPTANDPPPGDFEGWTDEEVRQSVEDRDKGLVI